MNSQQPARSIAPFRENVDGAEISNYNCGGTVRRMYEPVDVASLADTLRHLRETGEEFIVVGGGCNLLLADGAHDFSVISTRGVSAIDFDGERLICECGVRLENLVVDCASRGLAGLENLNRIPGTVGGAVFMNAGAYGSEICEVVEHVEFLTTEGAIETLPAAALGFSYRTSSFRTSGEIILRARLKLKSGEPETLLDMLEEIAGKRAKFDPIIECSCGSVFKNPEGDYAGRLLEECGFKGYRLGGARTLDTHANIVYNSGGASAEEIFALTRRMKQAVLERHGVELLEEVRFIGFNV